MEGGPFKKFSRIREGCVIANIDDKITITSMYKRCFKQKQFY